MSKKENPNILIIQCDELRYDCIGAYGNDEIETPNIDQLANDGVKYNNSFCTYPVCTPSRYSLLSGLYPHQHLGYSNHSTIPNFTPTFPKILKQSGYNTKAVGKMHFTPTYLDVGFEEMKLAEQHGPGRYDDDYHNYLKERDLIDKIDLIDQVDEFREKASSKYWDNFGAIKSDLKEKDYSTTWISNEGIETLNEWDESNNLLMVSFINPHHPFNPPSPWHKKYNPNNLSLLSGWTKKCIKRDLQKNKGYFPNENLTKSKMKKIMAYYYASISLIDHQIGKFIELLKEKGLYDNTLIVFTSDHGDYMGFHHMILKANYMYDPIMKVPLIIKYPYQKDKGVSSQKLVSNIDVATTILKQTDCEIGGDMSGYDLTTEKERDYIFAESGSDKNSELDSYMIRSHKYKLLINKDYKTLFFDLEEDPNEINNLINDPNYKKIINKLKDRLYRWLLFEAIPPLYINENEKIISKTNVSSLKDEEHNLRKNYFRKKIKKNRM